MPILKVPEGFRDCTVLWCDAPASTSHPSPGLVLLALDRPLPRDCILAVLGAQEDAPQHCLAIVGLARTAHRTIHAVPVPPDWPRFELEILSVAVDGETSRIRLIFDREADAAAGTIEHVLDVSVANGRLRLGPSQAAVSPVLRLFQRVTPDGRRPPATRLHDLKLPSYRLRTRTPRSRESGPAPADGLVAGGRPMFSIELIANTPEAERAMPDTRLWHASHALLAKNRSTLGLFESTLPAGFREIRPMAPHSRQLIFTIPGASPGDLLCLAPGLDEASIALAESASNKPLTARGPCAVFEIDRNGRLESYPRRAPEPDTLISHGEFKDVWLTRELEYQFEHISENSTGGRAEIARMTHALSSIGEDETLLQRIAAAAASPAIFAIANALYADLRESCPDEAVAADIAAIVDPRRQSFLGRLASEAVHLAIERDDVRQLLLRRASGNLDPWDGTDALRPVFDILFDRNPGAAAAGSLEPEAWYDWAKDHRSARIAAVAMAKGAGLATAQRIIAAGLQADLAEIGAEDLDSLVALGERYFARIPADRAHSDALLWAATEPSEAVGASNATDDILARLEGARAGKTPQLLLALRDLRDWKTRIRYDQIVARLAEIRDLLRTDNRAALRSIPTFDRGRPPFADGSDEATVRERLRAVRAAPRWEGLAHRASASTDWPPAARAALLATIDAMGRASGEEAARPVSEEEPRAEAAHGFDYDEWAREEVTNTRFLYDEPTGDSDGLVRKLQERAQRDAREREAELLREAAAAGERLDEERRAAIRHEAEQHGILGATHVLYKEPDSVNHLIEAIGKEMDEVDKKIRAADRHLQGFSGSARQYASARLEELTDEFIQLRKDYVDGSESRLFHFLRQPRHRIFGDVPGLEQDLKSAADLLYRLTELGAQIGELGPPGDASTDPG